ncbi:conserved exported hypothetical protein [Candidatus Sulfopaludibacter sp. SbA3]|nr:conserved exported hypothetical protein [Candidatus Sulfopaludibacter sp. SbA3]
MIRKVTTIAGIMTLAVSPLLADFSYQEKSTVTGGAMMSMLKVAAVFSKQAREPIETTVSVKGDRMVTRSSMHATIVDLNSQTITSVDLQKKTYSVMTFEEMKQMMEQMQQKMQNAKKNGDAPEMNFKVSVNDTGNKKEVNGYDAKEMILKMEMEGTDEKSGQKGGMTITTDMWVAPAINGYGEVREFHKRMAEKLNWTPGGNAFMARPEVTKGMAEVYKEASKIDGMPVQQKVVMGVAGDPGAQQQQQQQPAERPSLGGLLGVQRAKKMSSDQPADSSQPGSLLEMTTEMSGFSSSAVDDAQFHVPAGFKKVEPDKRRMQ